MPTHIFCRNSHINELAEVSRNFLGFLLMRESHHAYQDYFGAKSSEKRSTEF